VRSGELRLTLAAVPPVRRQMKKSTEPIKNITSWDLHQLANAWKMNKSSALSDDPDDLLLALYKHAKRVDSQRDAARKAAVVTHLKNAFRAATPSTS
jgi:hypothetical protein